MRPNDFLLVDYGPITLSKNLVQVDFDDVTEFEFYAGTTAADLVRGYDSDYLYYDTETPNFTDTKNPSLTYENTGVDSDYEALIDLVPTLVSRKADVYYGKTEAEQLVIARDLVVRQVYNNLRITDAGMLSDSPISASDKTTLESYRSGIRAQATTAKNATVSDLATVKAITVTAVPAAFDLDQCL